VAEDISVHITEGRAYRRGDLIILRSKRHLESYELEYLQSVLKAHGEPLGITFLILASDIEVVEPQP
jgi:hypothetical protein